MWKFSKRFLIHILNFPGGIRPSMLPITGKILYYPFSGLILTVMIVKVLLQVG
jgi:hypothetical protein